ncbi:arginine-ornithine antiporter [Phenylobacterium sp. Root77]|uniref:basic amino acid/polyamine antiporter n=1 Tax=unclassified Phenylobacterium TaxID=2640670 RepID=UPI0006F1C3BD|nr:MULTISPECIES: basic amino acid/polyamine antiporter [unclassified Phenylobacterium]KQW71726.1 arginine-ornithine antiporter [Phenylobacterium sp. Root1277]KQW94646.1 arginine-ornithine antiporter [Phenylobacterium sp. Root1290]KRC44339.1 arginine-ornithine antiporter [Phenylobacterium sp. Root77]
MTPDTTSDQKLSLKALIALVIGSMIGAGIFALPSTFARTTGGLGAIVAWAISGAGMLMLAFVFQALAQRRPDLDAGIFAYAKAGFGRYLGFISAIGYWMGACFADTACLILIKSTLGVYFPVFGDGTTVVAIFSASLLVWAVHFLVLRGVKSAATLNTIATYAKMIPIGLFLLVIVTGFRADIFALNFWGGEIPGLGTLAGQVRATLMLTVFVFVGLEGASVYSRYAKRREDVGIATVLGFLGVLCLLVLVTMLSFGVLLRPDLAALAEPSMAGIMNYLIGPWGGLLVSIGLLISVLGNYLSWCLLSAEVMHVAAQDGTLPSYLGRSNRAGAPAAALWFSNAVIQLFLIISWFAEEAFIMALKMTSAMVLIPYLLVAGYGLLLAWTGQTYEAGEKSRRSDLIRSLVATLYIALIIIVGGSKYVVLSTLLYLPATILFFHAMREQKIQVFSRIELLLFGLVIVGAVAGGFGLATGAITL